MTIQIAVKLPDELLGEVDLLVEQGTFASRSQAVRTGLDSLVTVHRRAEADRRYREAAARHPESAKELAEARRLAVDSIRDEPWERWW